MIPVSVVLVRPRNPLNIGAAARAMSNFGFFDLRLVEPYRVAMDEACSAVGAGELVASAKEFDTVGSAVADAAVVIGTTNAQGREVSRLLRRLEAGARDWQNNAEPLAILFGCEKHGLGKEDISHCHALWRIPTRGEHGSMNLGQAVAVVLYELIRDDTPIPTKPQRRAQQAELQRFEQMLADALAESGYVHSPSTMEKIRTLILRLDISQHDAAVWQGMMRQILWKLRHNRE